MKALSPRMRTWLIAGVALAAVVGAGAAWMMLPPRALSFAGGHPVSLADYGGPSPVGVPPELRADDVIARGKYLTEAADCEVCRACFQVSWRIQSSGAILKLALIQK